VSEGDGLPPLRDVVREHGLLARKSLGQNFLFDLNLTARIARAAGPLDGRDVLEVGPGPGGLTRSLLSEGAGRVVAVERDPRCLPALAAIAARYPGRLDVVEADAMDLDPGAFLSGSGPRIVSNLPYNVGTALLIRWLTVEAWPPAWASATLMFQREVADRIVADETRPADYGRLGVLCGWRTRARILFEVPPQAFVPPPKITSAVVLLEPRPAPLPCPVRALEAVTRAAFGQRRKMLRQSLKALGRDPAPLLAAAGLDGTERAEEVPVASFVTLARAFAA
jgi:16S rRNA (adenine1518-N6/adenine1519-N6)-dimethyltransferase